MKTQIRIITSNDIGSLVQLHIRLFKDNLSSFLGFDYLTHFYNQLILHEKGKVYGYFENEVLIAFCAVTHDRSDFYRLVTPSVAMIIKMFLYNLNFHVLLMIIRGIYKKFFISGISFNYINLEILFFAVDTKKTSDSFSSRVFFDHVINDINTNYQDSSIFIESNVDNFKAVSLYIKSGFKICSLTSFLGRSVYHLKK